MFNSERKKLVFMALTVTFLLFSASSMVAAVPGQGNLKGFVCSADRTTPVEGAVLFMRNIKNGTVYESNGTDIRGVFLLNDIEPGLYLAGVSTEAGAYNFERLIGIKPDTTGKVSFALREKKADDNTGEVLIGRVLEYDLNTHIAKVEIIHNVLQRGDRIHNLGREGISETDFYQKAKILTINGMTVEKVFKGQTVAVFMEGIVVSGDLVYLAKKKGILGFFTSASGLALLAAATAGTAVALVVPRSDTKDTGPTEGSPFK